MSNTVNFVPTQGLPGSGNVTNVGTAVVGDFPAYTSTTGTMIADSGFSAASFLQVANNLSDLSNAATARTNLGLTAIATQTVTQYDVLVGGSGNTITSIGPGAAGQVLQSGGNAANPAYSTATYPLTTTINQLLFSSAANAVTGLTAGNNGVLISSATGVPSWLADGTTGQVLTATTGSPPSWQNTAASSITLTGDSGGGLTGNSFILTGGTTGLTLSGASTTLTLGGTLGISNGGTAKTSVTTVPAATSWAGWDANKNFSANAYIIGFNQNTLVGGTSTLTVASAQYQHIGGSGGTIVLPDATTLTVSQQYYFDNDASGNVTIETNDGATLFTQAPGTFYTVFLASNGSAAGTWYYYASLPGLNITQYDVLVAGAGNTIGNVGPGTAGQVLQSGGAAANPAYSTATYPLTTTINQLLFSSAANTVTGLTAGNNGVLISSATGVPSWLADGTTGQVLTATTGSPPTWVTPATAPTGSVTQYDVLVGGAGNTIANVGPGTAGQVLQSGGAAANPAYSTATYPLTTTINQLLFSSAANTVTGLTAGNNGVLISSATGVPSWLSDGTTGQVLTATTGSPPTWQTLDTAVNYTNVNHAASPYTVLSTDYFISVDCSGGTVILNFPNSPTAKQEWIVKDRTGSSSTNNISITTPGGTVTFDGQTTYKITSNYGAVNILANSTPQYEIY